MDTPQAPPSDMFSQDLDLEIQKLSGEPDVLTNYMGNVLLIVNVASFCGRTPHYAGLQRLYESYASRGLVVMGFPCNQFNNEEPGSPHEIAEFCSKNYGVTFPMFSKIEVNGPNTHQLYRFLKRTCDGDGLAGDVTWNFEKFLISRTGDVAGRFRYTVEPESLEVIRILERLIHDTR